MGSLLKFVWPPLCLPEISWTCSPGCQSASKALACQFPWPLIKVQGHWWKSHQFAWSARYSGCSGPVQGHKKDFSVSGRTSLTFVSASTGTVMGRLVLFRASIYPPPLTDSDTGGHLARRGVITEPGKPDYGPRQSYNYTLAHFSSTIFSERNSGYLECQDIKCTMTVWIVHLRSSEIYIKGNLSPSFVREKFWMRVASDEGNKRIRAISAKSTHSESEDRLANSAQQQQWQKQ